MGALLSLVLAGAAVVPALPITPEEWFSSRDHPKTALAVAERGALPYRIVVSPDGAALRCETPGDTALDRRVCEVVMKTARFVPASDEAGRPAFGVHEAVARFLLPGRGRPRPDPAKLTITVDRLPDGAAGPAHVGVAFLVDAAGTIGPCAAVTTGQRRRSLPMIPALAPAACEGLAREYHPVPARDAAGGAVPSVQSAIVRFEPRQAR